LGAEKDKREKKRLKAEAKIAKAGAKSRAKSRAGAAKSASKTGAAGSFGVSLPEGVGIAIREKEAGSELIVSGLKKHQLERLLPQINKEILITIAEEKNTLRAGLMRFVREGVFQTLIKVVAGLIVGYLLLKFGLS
jgi:hypothetical protein